MPAMGGRHSQSEEDLPLPPGQETPGQGGSSLSILWGEPGHLGSPQGPDLTAAAAHIYQAF